MQIPPCSDPIMKPTPPATIFARALQALVEAPAGVLRLSHRSQLATEFDSLWAGAWFGASARPAELKRLNDRDDSGVETGELTEAARFAFCALDERSDDSDGRSPRW